MRGENFLQGQATCLAIFMSTSICSLHKEDSAMENKSVTIRISKEAWELLSKKVVGKFGYGQLITEAVMEKYGKENK
jgi:hypothetical protein